ncbi:MAG: DoxX family protein [Bacteroidetes bacterium]|nr:DoxX family protein [Bacteroidota bacterium]
MSFLNSTFLLRMGASVILFVHGVGGMFNNGVNNFGRLYLDQIGFAPFGIYLAWAIKLSHVACVITLLMDKHLKWPIFITIFILVMGIVMVHGREGWFVVGAGRNGVEFNFLLILVLLTILYPQGFKKIQTPKSGR